MKLFVLGRKYIITAVLISCYGKRHYEVEKALCNLGSFESSSLAAANAIRKRKKAGYCPGKF